MVPRAQDGSFSTKQTAPADRLAVWREVIGHTVLRLDIEPLPDIPFEADVMLQATAGLAMLSGVICGSRSGRTPFSPRSTTSAWW